MAGAAVVSATFTRVAPTVAQQGKPLVRGNAYGEWRHWGADQWSTRYSPLEQVNAGNFDSLQVAWEWKASAFGKDEYYRTTPIFANGRLFTVASTRRVATALDPETGETLGAAGAAPLAGRGAASFAIPASVVPIAVASPYFT